MTAIELIVHDDKHEATHTFYIDVVNRKLKCIARNAKACEDGEWFTFKELLGGKVGERMRILWPDDTITKTMEITSLRFVS